MKRLPVLVAAAVSALSLTLTAFTPSPSSQPQNGPSKSSVSPSDPTSAHRDPSDPAATKGYLDRLQRGVPLRKQDCDSIRFKGRMASLCLRTIDPKQARQTPTPHVERRAGDPAPPQALCSQKPGQTNYDRFHACYETVRRIEIVQDGTATVEGEVRTDVWATLSPKNPTWLMQVGITPIWISPDLVETGPSYKAQLACSTNQCKIPNPVTKAIGPGIYTYYELATSIPSSAPGDSIQYSNPQIKLSLVVSNGTTLTPPSPANDPFNVRCDSETYIGGEGCVYYMGTASAATFYIDYKDVDPKYGDYREVVKNDLYGEVVRDNLNHYGHIQFGHPLHRTDPVTQRANHDSICTKAILAKRPAGMQCDEWPYASSEEGGGKNPRYSCAFLPEEQNRAHGQALDNTLYKANRILPSLNEGGQYIQGDPYWVWVLNAPEASKIPAVKQCSTY
ncbi:NucA/NucB deoxyribonuclease domain-containing protein [Actinomadura violacea]|uniref:Deoxyribonuclease NucA/NucB domain-containing protein n=1 Tax=Actinomadura violacea TaxID=2819934 RepID=A0ABS3S667_9ACTN|nr:NucA/NucB deoxyribonuclease domain-containing protein [Actinomadura violacea]MBO2464503.1 hypothetical protein [Actinomadura violacea]